MADQKIGILGGGQLGAMLMRSAIDFGLNIAVLDKDPGAPCNMYCGNFTTGDLKDFNAVMEFGKLLDLITIEIEAVNTDALAALEQSGVKVFPSPAIITMVQDKYLQKQKLQALGMPTAQAVYVGSKAELKDKISTYPAVLKLCREGYDGRGVMILKSEEDLSNAFEAPSILEEAVDIEQEISVIVARNTQGELKTYDPVAMVFDSNANVLAYQLAPAAIPSALAEQAKSLATRIAEGLELVGILAVEMFLTKEGKLLVNELAPRPHNSGHHSIEGCVTSQFEQHLRAITGLPLGATEITRPTVMVNLLGNEALSGGVAGLQKMLEMDGVHLHWYGKTWRPGRKLGHVTITGDTIEEAQNKSLIIRKLIENE